MHTRHKRNKSVRCKGKKRTQRKQHKQHTLRKSTRHTRKGGFIGKILRRQRYSKAYNEDGKFKGIITSTYYDQLPEHMKLQYERRESRPGEYKLRKGFRMPLMQPLGQYSQQSMPQFGQPYMPQFGQPYMQQGYMPQGYMQQGYMQQPYMQQPYMQQPYMQQGYMPQQGYIPLGTTKTVIKQQPF